ncbi:MAG: cytochrome c biogenesis protein ResB, partial [Mycobacterium sp.]|nr:cytochrome c biogenesis protein ResB [Mycobacterium sp.]
SGTVRVDPPAGLYQADQRRKHQLAITGLFAPTQQMDGKLLSSSFPAMNDPAVAIDIYRGDAGLDTGRPQSLFTIDTRLIEQKRLTKLKRVNLTVGQDVRLDDGTAVRFDGATQFVNLQVSHDPGQVWVLVFALTMMAGLLVSLVVRRRRVWARVMAPGGQERSDSGKIPVAGTVNVELGGLARTDNSGWGEELDKLARQVLTEDRA